MTGFVGNIIPKDPDAALTYGMAWGDWPSGTVHTAVSMVRVPSQSPQAMP